MVLSYFNIALFPDDPNLQKALIASAQANCKTEVDQYLLGENALPHVTLCQLQTEPNSIQSLWQEIAPVMPNPIALYFHHLYMLPGKAEHLGFHWMGLAMAPDPILIELQKRIHEKLLSKNIQSRTSPSSYFPHLTWARCRGFTHISPVSLPAQEIWQTSHNFSLSLARSDANGIFKERLFPQAIHNW
jgi:2'-5' RNA ligase